MGAYNIPSRLTDLGGVLIASQLPDSGNFTWDSATATLAINGPIIRPNNTPIHFETLSGPNRSGVRFTYATNPDGFPFQDSEGNIRYDNVITWGWNLGGDYNLAWNPAYPSIYDTMEEAYLTSAGEIFGEYNYEGTHSSWPAARRWRSLAINHANGHGGAQHCGDYSEFKSNSGQYTMFQVGASTNNGFGPFGVYEVELTGPFSVYNGMGAGYTDGTGYALIFTGGGGTGAAGLFDVVGGKVKNLSLSSTGWGYTSAPTVSFANGGPGTGAEARVLIGSISATLPTNIRNVISGTQFWLGDTGTANRHHLVAATNNNNGSLFSGFNIAESAGVYQALVTGATSGVAYSASGGISWFVAGSQAAGTTLTPTMGLSSAGGLTLAPTASTVYFAVTLPTTQSHDLISFVKPGTGTPVFQVTKNGYIGNNAGSGVTAPIDVTRIDVGNMAQLGANGVKSLCTISYGTVTGSDVTITGSVFGPLQLRSQANQNINLLPNGTGKVTVAGPFMATTISPTVKPTIEGSRSDGTALANLLTALATAGLLTDATTP